MEQIKVLIAEDNDLQRSKLEKTLRENGKFEVVGVAKNGNEALKLIEKFQPKVVVTDIILSECDGFGVMEKCKKLGFNTRFLITSSLSSETFINKAMDLGADYYMIKPIEESILIDRIIEVAEIGGNIESSSKIRAKTTNKNKQLEEKISNIFITVGIPAHIKGYQFLREAIKLAIEKPDIINSITKELYPSIASHFQTSASKVERAIRHAIEVAWNRGKIENINSVFGIKVYSNNEKPTNGEFIALVADKMLIEG